MLMVLPHVSPQHASKCLWEDARLRRHLCGWKRWAASIRDVIKVRVATPITGAERARIDQAVGPEVDALVIGLIRVVHANEAHPRVVGRRVHPERDSDTGTTADERRRIDFELPALRDVVIVTECAGSSDRARGDARRPARRWCGRSPPRRRLHVELRAGG